MNNNEKIHIQTILPVYLSFTTIPIRIKRTIKIIKNILENLSGFDCLFLNLPMTYINDKYGQLKVSDLLTLDHLQRKFANRFKIVRSSIDYGPVTKLLPIVQRKNSLMSNESILLIFDDNCYHLDAFKKIAEKQCENLNLTFTYYSYNYKNKIRVPQGVDIVSFYFPNLQGFNEFVQYALRNQHCFYVDDLVIAKFLQQKGIPVRDIARHWTWPWIPECYNIPDKVSLFAKEGSFSRDNSMHYCFKHLKQNKYGKNNIA